MNVVASLMMLFSVLVPSKVWYAPSQAVSIKVDSKETVRLVLVDFTGKRLQPQAPAEVAPGQTVDIRPIYPQLAEPGSFVLLAVPVGKDVNQFVGTPLVLQARTSPRFSGPVGVNVLKVTPLVYAKMETDKGDMKILFWFDAAPNTVASFIDLSEGGFYDGLTFHRIAPGFVIQGGDPTGTGFGGPGYNVAAEFNDRPHDVGVLSMARTGDPLEGKGIAPRTEFANSAGSQFFICLSREKTASLDRKYTDFAQVFEGLDTVKKIAAVPVTDPASGKPKVAPVIKKVSLIPVTAADNPYTETLKLNVQEMVVTPATTAPATNP